MLSLNNGMGKPTLAGAVPNKVTRLTNQMVATGATINNDGLAAYNSLAQALRDSAAYSFFPYAYSADGATMYGMDNAGNAVPFSFSRTTSATVVDKDGNIKLAMKQNLVPWSEDLTQAGYSLAGATVSAQKLMEDNSSVNHYISLTTVPSAAAIGTCWSLSADFKPAERTKVWLYLYGSSNVLAEVDLASGQITALFNSGGWTNQSASITPLANGWSRVTLTATLTTAASVFILLALADAGNNSAYQGVAGYGVNVNRVQFKQEPSYNAYVKTTGAAKTIQVTRLAYDPSTGNFEGLQLEGASTNMLNDSSGVGAYWPYEGLQPVTSSVKSPFGSLAQTFYPGATAQICDSYAYVSPLTGNTYYSFSGFFKAGSVPYIALVCNYGTIYASFDLSSGTVFGQSNNVTNAFMVPYANGWWRCTLSFILSTDTPSCTTAYLAVNSSGYAQGNAPTFTGDGATPLFYADCFQFEQGGVTSFIPCYQSQTTRALENLTSTADIVPFSAASVFSWIKVLIYHYYGQVTPLRRSNDTADFVYMPGQHALAATELVNAALYPDTVDNTFNKLIVTYGSNGLRTAANASGNVSASSYSGSMGQGATLTLGGEYSSTTYVKAIMVLPRQVADSETTILTQ